MKGKREGKFKKGEKKRKNVKFGANLSTKKFGQEMSFRPLAGNILDTPMKRIVGDFSGRRWDKPRIINYYIQYRMCRTCHDWLSFVNKCKFNQS